MHSLRFIFVSVFLLLFCSCQEVLDFDPGDISPYPVLISKPDSEDSTLSVYISRSRFFLDENDYPHPITDANVTMSVNGVALAGFYDNSSERYIFGVQPHEGDTLSVTARVPGFDKAMTAGTRVPMKPVVEVVDFVIDTSYSYFREWDSTWVKERVFYRIKFKITSASPKEFYSVRAYMSEKVDENSPWLWDTNEAAFVQQYFECNDPIVNTTDMEGLLEGEGSTSFSGDEMVFSNDMFQGGAHEFTIEFERWENGTGYYSLDYSQIPLRLHVRSLSRDLYLYQMTTKQQSDMDIFFGEPVQVHCNIDGGLGVFGASSLRKISMPKPRFEHFHHDNDYVQYYKKKK
jgi:hypothetical protein